MSRLRFLPCLLLALGIPRSVALLAQVPDSARADTTATSDTTDYAALFLRTEEESRVVVPTLPRVGSPSLLPGLSRIVFDRDTIEWHNAQTLSDLLSKVPGVYLWRGGWVGRPEWPTFQGRLGASVRYSLDGMPMLPLGRDSVVVDPTLFPLSFLERVEIERLPGELRVHLFTKRHDRVPPRTRVSVSSGDFDIARYQGSLEQRSRSGLGFVVAAEQLSVPLSSDQQGAYSNLQGWLQLSYVPSDRLSASLQLIRGGPSREDVLDPDETTDTLSARIRGKRTDIQATFTYAARSDGLGGRLSAILARSSWAEDSTEYSLPGPINQHPHVQALDMGVTQLGVLGGYRTTTTALDASAWYRSRWTPLEVRASAAATPSPRLTGSVEAAYLRHDGGRSSRWVLGRGGVALPLGIQVSGLARVGSVVLAPAIDADSATSIFDRAILAGFDRPRFALEVGYWRTASSTPPGFSLYPMVGRVATGPPTKWVTVSARVAPRQWLILDGWYSDPTGIGPEGQPPTHSIVNATIQSKFLPTFRSGIFALKLQGSMESWGTGVIGRDPAGEAVTLPGATFFRAQIQFKIGSFIAYYDRSNMQGTRSTYVPGLPILRFASSFGVRWEFSN
ncbi:MAG: TonB-dependent receptor plug domain-containing protein [Gemmatimonadales bacterium]